MYVLRFASIVFIIAGAVFAQDSSLPTITSTGEASGSATPSLVQFRFIAEFVDSNLTGATEKASAFPPKFKSGLKTENIRDGHLTFRSPHIDSIDTHTVSIQAALQLSIPNTSDPSDQAKEYAVLCDQVSALAKSSGAMLLEPKLLVQDPEFVEQETLKRATENALYKADAIAQILGTKIYEVKDVRILELKWYTEPTNIETGPGIDKITCSAKVSLTYLHQP